MKFIALVTLLTFFTNCSFAQNKIGDSIINHNKTAPADSLTGKIQDSVLYATLYVYRSFIPKLNAPLKKVPIFINDTLVHELKVNTVMALKIFREGKYNLTINKKGEEQTPFKVKFGKEYFFKCEILGGLLNKRTLIYAVTPKVGRAESGILETE